MKIKHVIPELLLVCFMAAIVIMISSCKKQEKVTGCTDENALNYNPMANDDDGSCIIKVFGCMDLTSLNYNPLANVDNGSCVAKVMGCMDATALNYNPLANVDDGSCIVPEVKQRAIFLNFTATWGIYDGQWGIARFEEVIATMPNEVVPLSCHQNDEMSNMISESIAIPYNLFGVPSFILGNQPESDNLSTLLNNVTITNSTAPIANAVATMTVSGSTINIKTQTKFFTASSGEYYLATYFVENGLVYQQTGSATNPVTHKHVLRGVAAGDEHGEVIANGSIAAGTVVNKDYSYIAPAEWNMSNVYVALVIWKYTGTTWTFVNAWQSKAN